MIVLASMLGVLLLMGLSIVTGVLLVVVFDLVDAGGVFPVWVMPASFTFWLVVVLALLWYDYRRNRPAPSTEVNQQ